MGMEFNPLNRDSKSSEKVDDIDKAKSMAGIIDVSRDLSPGSKEQENIATVISESNYDTEAAGQKMDDSELSSAIRSIRENLTTLSRNMDQSSIDGVDTRRVLSNRLQVLEDIKQKREEEKVETARQAALNSYR